MDEPLSAAEARRFVREVLEHGALRFSKHAREEMVADGMSEIDVVNTLRGGQVLDRFTACEHGSWRYRAETQRFAVVFAFRDELSAVVVTAWRRL